MLPTTTNEIRKSILLNYLGLGLVGFLIYKPDLGFDDTPTEAEFLLRKELDMETAVNHEIGGLNLNGYQRCFVPSPDIVNGDNFSTITISLTFEAIGGEVGPFTHVCLACNANVLGGNPYNGNNRGNYQGDLILTMPVTTRLLSNGDTGLILTPPEKYSVRIPINLSSYLI